MTETTAIKQFATGKVTLVKDGLVVFTPTGTRYELHLVARYDGPLNTPVKCMIRAAARKVYTVPSGGNYITPIFGPPRIVQGLVRSADQRVVVVQAGGCPFHIDLPAADSGIDLDDGPIYLGKMVNVVCEPGVRAEFV
ncbi:MAG TPA: hypothetical protein VK797_02640 [Tepidisphaeraceae bacterium]|jgi:hypothetical protein|nr:hypothetical protein [Tepidisphaeraceae bacterium]